MNYIIIQLFSKAGNSYIPSSLPLGGNSKAHSVHIQGPSGREPISQGRSLPVNRTVFSFLSVSFLHPMLSGITSQTNSFTQFLSHGLLSRGPKLKQSCPVRWGSSSPGTGLIPSPGSREPSWGDRTVPPGHLCRANEPKPRTARSWPQSRSRPGVRLGRSAHGLPRTFGPGHGGGDR